MPSGFAWVGRQVRGTPGDLLVLPPPSVCSTPGVWEPVRPCLSLPLARAPHVPLPASRVQVEFYVNENTFKERLKLFFIKNQRSSEQGLGGWGPGTGVGQG